MGGWNETKRNTTGGSCEMGISNGLVVVWQLSFLMVEDDFEDVELWVWGEFGIGWVSSGMGLGHWNKWKMKMRRRWCTVRVVSFFFVVAGGTWCCSFGPTIFAKDLICPTSRGQRQADYTPQVTLKWSHNGLVFQRHPCEFKWPTHISSHNPQEKKSGSASIKTNGIIVAVCGVYSISLREYSMYRIRWPCNAIGKWWKEP